jgi:hypothetical protein
MTLDAAFERADQAYRNRARLVAAAIAILLAQGAAFIYDAEHADSARIEDRVGPLWELAKPLGRMIFAIGPETHFIALLVGLLAVPVAPIAKDLTTSLSTAVNALKASRSVKG